MKQLYKKRLIFIAWHTVRSFTLAVLAVPFLIVTTILYLIGDIFQAVLNLLAPDMTLDDFNPVKTWRQVSDNVKKDLHGDYHWFTGRRIKK